MYWMAQRQVFVAIASTMTPGAEAAAGRLMGEHRGHFPGSSGVLRLSQSGHILGVLLGMNPMEAR